MYYTAVAYPVLREDDSPWCLYGALVVWVGMVFGSDAFACLAQVSMAFAFATLTTRFWRVYQDDGVSGLAHEIAFGLKSHGIVLSLILWPVELVRILWGTSEAYREMFWRDHFVDTMRSCRGIHKDTANDMGRYAVQEVEVRADNVIGTLQDMEASACQAGAVMALGAATVVLPYTAHGASNDGLRGKVTFFSDREVERQLNILVNYGRLSLMLQNRALPGERSAFTFLGVGANVDLPHLSLMVVAGPQYTYDAGVERFNRVSMFVNGRFFWGPYALSLGNRFSWGINEQTPYVHRHAQSVRVPWTPNWLGLDFQVEEFVGAKGLGEFFIGPEVSFDAPYVPNARIKIYPYADLAPPSGGTRGDVRFTLEYTF